MGIVVVGSCMIDFVSYASKLPKAGETIHGTEFVTNFGGKGANQCVAAAKLLGKTSLIARVGDDLWGEKYLKNLTDLGINTDFVKQTKDSSTGIAQIIVSTATGENQIVIVAGANNYLSVEDVEMASDRISSAEVVVLQLETSEEVAIRALQLSKGISILNGAPALAKCNSDLFRLPTIFCVNESEASVFSGLPVNNKCDAEKAALKLIEKGCNSVLITLGAEGALYVSKDAKAKCIHVQSPQVKCVDSTGAGDAFIGALAVLLERNNDARVEDMEGCLKAACKAAADSVTRPGTQISFAGTKIFECN